MCIRDRYTVCVCDYNKDEVVYKNNSTLVRVTNATVLNPTWTAKEVIQFIMKWDFN